MYNSVVILNVYKPKGITSFDVVYKVRKSLGIKKVGHAGTLDPLAEGVLIVLMANDTKKQSEFMSMEKEYEAEIGFGIYTGTYDLEVVPEFTDTITLNEVNTKIDGVLDKFIGRQNQEVPMYSAVSVNGQRLYKLARKGKTVEDLPSREINISSIRLVDFYETKLKTNLGDKTIPVAKIKVTCSSGTYIRSLVRDIGKSLNVNAVMLSLVRTRIGDFNAADSKQISDIKL